MRTKHLWGAVLLTLLAFCSTLSTSKIIPKASGQNPATISVSPPSNKYEKGQIFTINITFTNVWDEVLEDWLYHLHQWDVTLKYDDGLLYTNETLIKEGPFLKGGGTTFFPPPFFGAGYVQLGCLLIVSDAKVGGSGTLANITFVVKDTGKTNLTLTATSLKEPYNVDIPHTTVGGVFYTSYPKAIFKYSPSRETHERDPVVGETITFNASLSYDPDGYITNYLWNLGDGSTKTGQIVYHSYAENKKYVVVLTVTDNDTKTDEETRADVYVEKRDVAIVDIKVSPTLISQGEDVFIKVNITNLGSVTEEVNVTTYYRYDSTDTLIWYNKTRPFYKASAFSTILERSFLPSLLFLPGKGIIINYTWSTIGVNPGTYTIWANISLMKRLNVAWPMELDYNFTNNRLVEENAVTMKELPNLAVKEGDIVLTPTLKAPAIIRYGTSQVSVNVTVRNVGDFEEEGFYLTLYQGNTLLQNWTDISLAAKATITKQYLWGTASLPIGNYTIRAEVGGATPVEARTDDNNVTLRVAVTLPPVASFTYSPSKPLVGQVITFNASASHAHGWSVVSYEWTFDRPQAPKTAPITQWATQTSATYNVTLTVTDSHGLKSTTFQLVHVGILPKAKFSYSPTSPHADEPITFDASQSSPNSGSIINYVWNFGDANVTTVPDPIIVHSYTRGGNFTVNLTIVDSEELTASLTRYVFVTKLNSTISVYLNPPTKIILGETLTINGTISPAPEQQSVVVTVTYKLGEGSWSFQNVTADENGRYTYSWNPTAAGTYDIKALWYGDEKYNADESEVKTITVEEPPKLDIILYVAGGALAVIAIASIVFFLKRRKTP